MRRFGIGRSVGLAAIALVASLQTVSVAAAQESRMSAPIVFFDIAGPEPEPQARFYREVFGWEVGPGGQLSVQVTAPLTGVLRTDPAEKMIYIGVPDVTAALARVTAHGGQVAAPRFEVPGVVVLGLFTDPAGNRLGLVEMDGDRAKVP